MKDNNFGFFFYRFPFVYLSAGLFAGVVSAFYSRNESFFAHCIGIFVLCALLVVLVSKKNRIVTIPLIILSFFTIGWWSMEEKNPGNSFENAFTGSKEGMYVIRITDAGQGKREWRKMLGIVLSKHTAGEKKSLQLPVVMYMKHATKRQNGDVLLVGADLQQIKNDGNPGEFDAEAYWSKKGIQHMLFVDTNQYLLVGKQEDRSWLNGLVRLRQFLVNILQNFMKGDELAVTMALVLGDKSLLEQEVTASFTNTGAMHVLAVSGLHVGIIMQILMTVFGYFPHILSRKKALVLVLLLMWIYAFITGLSPSVLRAVFMFSVLLLAQWRGRNYNEINALFLTGFVLVLIDPFTLFDIGFQLSFLAMLGIFLFYKRIESFVFVENRLLKMVWSGTAIGLAAQVMTTPLSLYYFHQFPNYFILTNIGLMASSGLILGGGLLLFSIHWWTWLAKFVAVVLALSVFFSLVFIRWVEDLPGAVAYGYNVSLVWVFLCTLLAIYLIFPVKNKTSKAIAGFIACYLLIHVAYRRYDSLTRSEICVLNARKPIVLLKRGENIFCFYKCRPRDFPKVQRAVEGYQKLNPGTVRYFSVYRKNWRIRSGEVDFQVKNEKGTIDIKVNREVVHLELSNKPVMHKNGDTYLAMPWVHDSQAIHLNNGAYRLALKKD